MSAIDQPTPERTTTVNDDDIPDWDGAPVVKDRYGDRWYRAADGDGYHALGSGWPAARVEKLWGPVTVVTPAPEPRTVTWRRGEDETTILEARKPGRRVRVVSEMSSYTLTRDGEINSDGLSLYTLEGWLSLHNTSSITVWLPEAHEVPEWAQDCDDWLTDCRLVATEDGRVWEVVVALGGIVTRWRTWSSRDEASTEELAAMGARLLIDRDGKAVLP